MEEIDRLRFHFSGHGVHNARIQLEPDEEKEMRERGQSDTSTNKTPVGECWVGTTEELYSVHDLKRKLLECVSNKITITLDCCRTQHRGPETRLALKLKEKLPLAPKGVPRTIRGSPGRYKGSPRIPSLDAKICDIYNNTCFVLAVSNLLR